MGCAGAISVWPSIQASTIGTWRDLLTDSNLVVIGTLSVDGDGEIHRDISGGRWYYRTGQLECDEVLLGTNPGDKVLVAWFIGVTRDDEPKPPKFPTRRKEFQDGDTGIWILLGPGYPREDYFRFEHVPLDSLEQARSVLNNRATKDARSN